MQFEIILEFNETLSKIKHNLSSLPFVQSELDKVYIELDSKLKKISKNNQEEIVVFRNLMIILKDKNIDNNKKFIIIDGALSFAYFLNDKNIEKTKSDPQRKTLYLKMLEAAYPEFNNKLIKEEDLTKDNLNKINDYLLCLNQISQTFSDEDGYDGFMDNLLKFFEDKKLNTGAVLHKDLVSNINLCFGFISEVNEREEKERLRKLKVQQETILEIFKVIAESQIIAAKSTANLAQGFLKLGLETAEELKKLDEKYNSKKSYKYLWITVFVIFLILFIPLTFAYFPDFRLQSGLKV